MDTITNTLIELKCQILDVLYVKRLQGITELPVSELLEELGMDRDTNITGLNPDDTIELTSKTLDDVEAAKRRIRASMFH